MRATLATAVVCGYSSWSPVKVLAFDRTKPPLALPLVKKPRKTHFADETKKVRHKPSFTQNRLYTARKASLGWHKP